MILKNRTPSFYETIVNGDVGLELLWSRSGIKTTKRSHIFAATARGILFYVAPKEHSLDQEVVSLEANDGETVLWRTLGPGTTSPSVLDATSSALFIGGNGRVAAYDLRTGEKLWSRSYPLQRTVTHLQVVDDLVYVKAVSDFRILLESETGQEIKDWNSTPNFTLDYFENKSLTGDIEIDNGPGTISVKDRQTSRILWETNALSNGVVTESAIYLMRGHDGELKLLGVEPRGGEIIKSVTFAPCISPDYLNLYDFPHRLTIDKELGILYVFLRDSQQLFAFKIVGYSGN